MDFPWHKQPIPGTTPGLELLDLSKYDFNGLRQQVQEIVNPLDTTMRIGAWFARLAPIALFLLSWIFQRRMSGVGLWFFLIIAGVCMVFAVAAISAFVVLRNRIDQTTDAAGRVIEIVELLHTDFLDVQRGAVSFSMRQVGSALAQEVVLPTIHGAAEDSTNVTGFLAILLRPMIKIPLRLVDRAVLRSVETLPDTPMRKPVQDLSIEPDSTTALVSEQKDELVGTIEMLTTTYQEVQHRLGQVVGFVGLSLQGPAALIVLAACTPFLCVVALGWWLS